MKKFLRNKTLEEVRAQCVAQGLALNTTLYDRGESDFIKVSSDDGKTEAKVFYSPFNGRFFGTVGAGGPGMSFSSDDASSDGTPWFDALLDFFYVRKTDAASS